MKKILIGLFRYQIGHTNASSISTDVLADYLQKMGLDITVICPKTTVKKAYKIKFYTSKPWKERYFIINLIKFIKKINKIGANYDLVYLILPNPAFIFIGDLIKAKIPIIVRSECCLYNFNNFKFSFNKIGFYILLKHLFSNKIFAKISSFSHHYLVSTN